MARVTIAAQAVARVTLADVTSTRVLAMLAAVIEGVVAAFIDVNTDGGAEMEAIRTASAVVAHFTVPLFLSR